ncbi:hypothetical protein [Campylobacter concisus]|jgi:hypothetical protein|uniref:hypothetical protein n=1 Tax=Campylobacter concisus TaxID=199 RepID=UPI000D327A3C|nr:hypothetical protein [Campylobacter concisus]
MNDINITYSCEESLKKIKEYMADAKSVTLYTSSLNYLSSYSGNIIAEIVSDLIYCKGKDKDISIITDFYVDKESFKDSKLNRVREFKYKGIPVKVVHKKSAIDKFFENLREGLTPLQTKIHNQEILDLAQDEHDRELLKDGNEVEDKPSSFYHMFELIVSNYNEAKNILRDCLKTLKNDLLNDAKSLIASEGLDEAKFERSIKECFDELDKNLKELSSENGEFIIKQIALFILSLVDITDPKAIIKKSNLGFVAYELGKMAYAIHEYDSNRVFYGVSLPILSFFTSRFASIVNTLNISSNCNVLVFKSDKNSRSGFFLDFTHLNLDYRPFKYSINEKETNYNTDEGYSVYGYLDDVSVFDYSKEICSYDVVNKNLGFGSSDDTLFSRLKDEIKSTNANLNFICASNFNSIKLANLIADKSDKNNTSVNDEMNSKDFSNLNKNYIILSNSPFRSSAGLREEVISKSLDQTIKDDINRSKSSNLVKQKFSDIKTLNPVKDYSKYSIDIDQNNDKSTLLLNLSPFARIEKSYIDNIEENKEKYSESYTEENSSDAYDFQLSKLKYDELFDINVSHINAYAKQPNDMEKIKESEKEYMEKSTLAFKAVFDRVNKNVSDRMNFEDECYDKIEAIKEYEILGDIDSVKSAVKEILDDQPTPYYSLLEVLCLGVAYFIMTKSYSGELLNKSIKNSREYIKVGDEEISTINVNSFVKLGDSDIRLFFYKESAKSSGLSKNEYLCIEEISDYMDGAGNTKNVYSIKELLEENDSSVNTNIKDPLQSDLMKLLIEQANDIDESCKKDKTLIKEVIASKDKDVLKKAIDLEYKAYHNDRDMDKEVSSLLVKTAIEGLFPIAGFASEDGISKIYEMLSSFIFERDAKKLKDAFLDELGVLNLIKKLFSAKKTKQIDEYFLYITRLKTTNIVLQRSKLNLILQAQNTYILYRTIEHFKLNISYSEITTYTFMRYTYSFNIRDVELMKKEIKDYTKTLGKDIGISMITGLIELYKTSYEKLEENYKEIMHTRYTYKFNEAYALNNISYKPISIKEAYDKNSTNSYCYYPVMIYQNYISLNLNRLFLGANINSGGLDYNSFIYYDINNKQSKLSHNLASKLALNNLSAYLCLDELRGAGNEIDANYFKYARSRYTNSDVEIRGLNLDVKEEKEIYSVYNKDDNQDGYSFSSAIKAYQKAVEIINKFKKGIFNTSDENNHSNLSRDLIKALDTIGNNNIKGVYVGCKVDLKDRSKENIPPRLIGRLATTIVMEDGLYIG